MVSVEQAKKRMFIKYALRRVRHFFIKRTSWRAATIVSFAYIKCFKVSSRHMDHNSYFAFMLKHKNFFSAGLMAWNLECKSEWALWKHVWYNIKLPKVIKKKRDVLTEEIFRHLRHKKVGKCFKNKQVDFLPVKCR